jgi:type IV secretion system protein TrbL
VAGRVLCFFVLAIQLFITLIEFKLTTLAGFVLVPFALWNKTAFLAEKVLGNVVSSGIKVLVLAVIVGIGSGLFAEFQVHPAEPSIDHALVIMLASLTLLALGIFGPGIATGLVSGAPQLGAGAMAGAAVARPARPSPSAPPRRAWAAPWLAGARMAPGCRQAGRQRCARRHVGGQQCEVGVPGRFRRRWRRRKGAMAGLGNVAKTGAQSTGRAAASRASAAGQRMAAPFRAGWNGAAADGGAGAASGQGAAGEAASGAATAQTQEQPAWAKRLHRRQQLTHAATTTAHALRGGDGGGSGSGPSLRDSDS